MVSFSLNHLSNLSILLSLVCFQTFVVRSPWLAFTVNPVTIAKLRGCEAHHQFFSCYYFEDNTVHRGKKIEYFICQSERCIYARTPKLELSALACFQIFIISPWLAFCVNPVTIAKHRVYEAHHENFKLFIFGRQYSP